MSKENEAQTLEVVTTPDTYSNLINFGMVTSPLLQTPISWSIGQAKDSRELTIFKDRAIIATPASLANVNFFDGFRIEQGGRTFLVSFMTFKESLKIELKIFELADDFTEVEFTAVYNNGVNELL